MKKNLPCEVVEEVVEEDHSDDTLAKSSLFRMHELLSSQSNPDSERAAHSTGSDQEQWSTTDTINHQGPKPCFKHVDHEDETVESVLVPWICDANTFQNVV